MTLVNILHLITMVALSGTIVMTLLSIRWTRQATRNWQRAEQLWNEAARNWETVAKNSRGRR